MPNWKKVLTEGSLDLDALGDFSKGSGAVNSGNYETLMPSVGDWYYRTGQSNPEIYIRQSTYIVERLDPNEWSSSGFDFTPVLYDPNATDVWFDLNTTGGATTISPSVVGQSRTVYARCTYDFTSSSGTGGGTPYASASGTRSFTSASDYKNTNSFSLTRTTVGSISVGWVGNGFTHDDGSGDGAREVTNDAGSSSMSWGQYQIYGSTNDSAVPVAADISDASSWTGTEGRRSLKTSSHTNFGNYKQIAYGDNCRVLFAFQSTLGSLAEYQVSTSTTFPGATWTDLQGPATVSYDNGYRTDTFKVYYTNPLSPPATRYFRVQ